MSERTRIRKIQVSKLFGIFDHEILLNLDERITIIHGPNGYGKTVILQMLDWLFSRGWRQLRRFPFGELVVEFEDGGVVRVTHTKPSPTGQHLGGLHCTYVDRTGAKPRNARFVTVKARQRSHATASTQTQARDHEWMQELRERLSVHFIRTQRLSGAARGANSLLTVSEYSEGIAQNIESLLATYASRSQEIDSTFLERLLDGDKKGSSPLITFQRRLDQIDQKRSQLIALGLLDQERETHKPPPKLDETKRDVLSVYIDDTERKLGVFDDMSRKVQLLTDAVNRRFKYKRMRVSKDEGFIFESAADGERIPLDSLSSGEQHELVLLYELLFRVTPDTLVLIDEPEISLHLAWQQQFLGDLVEMVKLSSFDVLIATHSPGIIGKRWDLTVELKGPDLGNGVR